MSIISTQELPIIWTEHDKEKFPQTSELLRQLGKSGYGILTPQGIEQRVASRSEELKFAMERHRTTFLEVAVMIEELETLLDEVATQTMDNEQTMDYMAAETTLRVCEAIQHVWLPQSDESQTKSQDNLLSSEHLLGVTPNMLMDQAFPDTKTLEDLQNVIVPAVEQRIVNKALQISKFYDPSSKGTETTLSAIKVTKIAEIVQQQVDKMKQEQELLIHLRVQTFTERIRQFKIMAEMIDQLSQLASKIKLAKCVGYNDAILSHLRVSCSSLSIHVKALQKQYLSECYTSETVPALFVIRQLLDKEYENLVNQRQQLVARLSNYESIGRDFDELVNEYSQLQEAIEEKREILQRITDPDDSLPCWMK